MRIALLVTALNMNNGNIGLESRNQQKRRAIQRRAILAKSRILLWNRTSQQRTRGNIGSAQAGRQQREANAEIAMLFHNNGLRNAFLHSTAVTMAQPLTHIAHPGGCNLFHAARSYQLIEE